MTDGNDYVRLRETFNEDAERYDRARPRYPEQMFDDLAAAGVGPGARVLEIGCGTVRATVPLAKRVAVSGSSLTCKIVTSGSIRRPHPACA